MVLVVACPFQIGDKAGQTVGLALDSAKAVDLGYLVAALPLADSLSVVLLTAHPQTPLTMS